MQKPREVKTIEQADEQLSVLFKLGQGKEFQYLEFSGAGVWPEAASVGEKNLVLAKNTADNAVRLYTKIAGTLKYMAFT